MPKNKKPSEKYVKILDKFGLLPQFDFTKKERKIVKYLGKVGPKDLLDIGDHLDYKPEKVRKVVDRLIAKGAVIEKDNVVELTPIAIQYISTIKNEKKSAKTFYRFVDTLSEKELDEFMKLVSSFKVAPKEAPIEEIKEILEEGPKVEEKHQEKPKAAPKRPAAKKPARKPAAKKRPAAKKPAAKKPAPKAKPEPKPEEPKPEEKEQA